MSNIIMHVDVNSAFLSWTAAYEQQMGLERDIREVASVIGGNEENRHGIVLAKSMKAKKYGIKTGNSLMEARLMCPNLLVVPPNYQVYVRASKSLYELLNTFSPDIEVFSIDECFIRFMDLNKEKAIELAYSIKEQIKQVFGYTVNIGISTNKLLAKMAGDFEKPDKCHTCFPEEIKEKMWILPVENLFMVGRRTQPKLNKLGIYTIGDLANADFNLISTLLKSHGRLIYAYANGHDASTFKPPTPIKSVGNSSTLKFNVEDIETAHVIILSLVEMTAWRLREAKMMCSVVSISIKDSSFGYISRQKKLQYFTDCTQDIYKNICSLFDKVWDKNPIRQLGVSVSDLDEAKFQQLSIFKDRNSLNNEKLDKVIDKIREKYGDAAIIRGVFANSDLEPLLGGYPDDEYPGMSSIL
ncbi:DNA polymerase-4 [Sedimentibacter acidaminivorans]|uniref:DNA polymerase IV n=1 Tax=Sedimentibacter acidaminivorans TaxID=913099 RepID=A0ABS4GBY0_9FIRM|nr:DNA polymerase IV [Sedimentibacter acidaminivorans]MBP1925188.1 DNA polymerase-4 [Sedimentibacter acidaminivorans]